MPKLFQLTDEIEGWEEGESAKRWKALAKGFEYRDHFNSPTIVTMRATEDNVKQLFKDGTLPSGLGADAGNSPMKVLQLMHERCCTRLNIVVLVSTRLASRTLEMIGPESIGDGPSSVRRDIPTVVKASRGSQIEATTTRDHRSDSKPTSSLLSSSFAPVVGLGRPGR